MTDQVQVHVDLGGNPVRAGTAYFTRRRRSVSTSFSYQADYLADPRGYALDPALPLTSGAHHVDGLPGAFQDCAPDRWGRNLIRKRMRSEARLRAGVAPDISDIDYLLGVGDLTRQGALRFRNSDDGAFLDAEPAVPPLLDLPRLLRAADRVARDDDDMAAVKELLDAGSGSLGGARPKASVRAQDGRLLIAKFPHHTDSWNVMAWEKTALDLAARAGVPVPGRRLMPVGGAVALLLDRFDRGPDGTRTGYISAMTLVGGRDGEDYDYEDVIDVLPEHGSDVKADLAGLFRRITFSVAVHNVDDHLRNHGFLRSGGGWTLSPVFDVNPQPDLDGGRATSIAGASRVEDEVEGLRAVARACRLADPEMRATVMQVLAAVTTWRSTAETNGVRPAECSRFAPMFERQHDRLQSAFG